MFRSLRKKFLLSSVEQTENCKICKLDKRAVLLAMKILYNKSLFPVGNIIGIVFIKNDIFHKKKKKRRSKNEGSGSGVICGTKYRKPLSGPWKAVKHLTRTRRPGFSLVWPTNWLWRKGQGSVRTWNDFSCGWNELEQCVRSFHLHFLINFLFSLFLSIFKYKTSTKFYKRRGDVKDPFFLYTKSSIYYLSSVDYIYEIHINIFPSEWQSSLRTYSNQAIHNHVIHKANGYELHSSLNTFME